MMKHKTILLAGIMLSTLATATAAVPVWNLSTHDALPKITATGFTPEGFRVEMTAPQGAYAIEFSPDLTQWNTLGTIEPVNGLGEFTDTGALAADSGFYRTTDGFDETGMHVLIFTSSVSSAGPDEFQRLGSMWNGHGREHGSFQTALPASGLFTFQRVLSTEFRLQPANAFASLSGFSEFWGEEDSYPIAVGPDTWDLNFEDGSLSLRKAEGGDYSLIALKSERDLNSEGSHVEDEASVEMILLGAKTSDAQTSDLTGDWGIIRVALDAEETSLNYSGSAYVASVTAGSPALHLTSSTEFEIDQVFVSDVVEASITSGPVALPLPFTLSPDGSILIEGPDEEAFDGFVTASGQLLAAAGTVPGIDAIPPGENELFQPTLAEANTQWLVAVKRDSSPQLGGRTYRVIRKGWWVEAGGFEIDESSAGDQFVFNADGTSATRTLTSNFYYVPFSGGALETPEPGEGLLELTMSASYDAEGLINMETSVPDEGGTVTVRSFGFSQAGGDLLILVDAITTTEGSAGLGLTLAVREP